MPGRWRTVSVGIVSIAAVAVVSFVHGVYFEYRTPHVRAGLETGITLVGTLVAFMCLGRYRRTGRVADLMIVVAMVLLAVAPGLTVLTQAMFGHSAKGLAATAPLGARVIAALLLAAASFVRTDQHPRMQLFWLLVAAAGTGAVVVVLWRGVGLDPDRGAALLRPELSEHANILANPIVTMIEFGASGLFCGAGLRFALRREHDGDAFMSWLGTGSILAAVASLDYGLFPSLNPGWLHTGDLLRACAFAAWGVGAAEEIGSYWSEMARLARFEERRRIARDLHDGLAQELAFLVTHVKAPVERRASPDWLPQLRAATERALGESRRAISALGTDTSLPLDADLGRTAGDIASRAGARVHLDVSGDVILEPSHRETLVRIVREAVTNATTHGRATVIDITVVGGDGVTLRVHDNGIGFEPSAAGQAGKFGLTSMRERAEGHGGTFAVHSTPGGGTTVEVAWR